MAYYSNEELEQQTLIQWAQMEERKRPELALLFHVPNGGKRPKAIAGRMRAAGQKSGVPDLVLPLPRGEYHALYIEMKYGKNRPTKNQKWWLHELSEQGNLTCVCYSWLEAKEKLLWYLDLPKI